MDFDQDLLDKHSPETRFAAMAALRRQQPIRQILGDAGPYYLSNRAAVSRALPAIDHFGGAVGAADVPEEEQAFNGLLEPRHGKIRRIVNGLIAPHKSSRAKPFVDQLCQRLLDDLGSRDANDEVDVMAHYVDAIPASTVCWLLGWPIDDAIQLYQWTVEVCERALDMRPGSGNTQRDIHPAFYGYIEGHLARRTAIPEDEWPDDGISHLLRGEVDGQRLSPRFVCAQLFFLLGAGAETTRDMIGGLLHSLACEPDLYQRVRADRSLIPNAIEEALRIFSPTQFMVRSCVAPIEIEGQCFEPGDQIFIGLASANRDEAHFEDADRFDIDRANAREHLAFGAGPHQCPGAILARMEATAAVNAFLDRFDVATPTNGRQFEPLTTPMFYGPRVLPMRLG
ncbi:cytochrome P450 [Myxococcota bacterium]|nr:cytochrome P450 [Myxococcota bacterium]